MKAEKTVIDRKKASMSANYNRNKIFFILGIALMVWVFMLLVRASMIGLIPNP